MLAQTLGVCSPNLAKTLHDDDGGWICVIPFLQAVVAELVSACAEGTTKRPSISWPTSFAWWAPTSGPWRRPRRTEFDLSADC